MAAISRSQLLKELLPGLNALFGLEYKRYDEQHKDDLRCLWGKTFEILLSSAE